MLERDIFTIKSQSLTLHIPNDMYWSVRRVRFIDDHYWIYIEGLGPNGVFTLGEFGYSREGVRDAMYDKILKAAENKGVRSIEI